MFSLSLDYPPPNPHIFKQEIKGHPLCFSWAERDQKTDSICFRMLTPWLRCSDSGPTGAALDLGFALSWDAQILKTSCPG